MNMRNALCSSWLIGAGLFAAQAGAQSAVPEVLSADAKVELVKEGFKATEGPMRDKDGGVLFTDNQANQIIRIAADGTSSPWAENTGGANALTRTPNGDVVATLVGDKVIAVMQPGAAPRVVAREFEGKPFNRPNDLVSSRKGIIYFTDTAAVGATNPALPSAVYQLSPGGELRRLATDIARPNGVALSPDERTLYVANTTGEWIVAFDVDASGRASEKHRDFAHLVMPPPPAPAAGPAAGAAPAAAGATPAAPATPAPPSSGADGIAVDEKGRLFVATSVGVQVFSARGEALGIITLPKTPQNLAFAGAAGNTLYVVGRGAVYRIATQTRGPDRAGK